MKLNKEGREELRAFVEKELKNIPEGKRVQLEQSLLNILLFETVAYKKSPKRIVKLPVWSGKFLRKIDLSEVSFKDVSWSLLGEGEKSELGKQFFDDECWDYFLSTFGKLKNNRVDYSETNIAVDFNHSWEMKVTKGEKEGAGIRIVGCNFSSTDLSNIDISHFREVRTSNFSNSGLIIPESLMKANLSIFSYTDLSGIDLSKFMVKLLDIITVGGPLIGVGCNLSNTRLSILLDSKSLSNKVLQKNFRTVLMAGDLNGCFINGKRVLSFDEKKEMATKRLEEYEKYKQKQFEKVRQSIAEQIGSITK